MFRSRIFLYFLIGKRIQEPLGSIRAGILKKLFRPSLFHNISFVNEDDSVRELYGIYKLKGFDDADSNTHFVDRNTKLGILFPDELPGEVDFLVEYKDYPLYDFIIIYITEKK